MGRRQRGKFFNLVLQGLASCLLISIFVLNSLPSLGQNFLVPFVSPTGTRIFVAGDIEYASVHLDGFALFQIASQDFTTSEARELSPVERRARRIERGLNNIINRGFDPTTLQVSTATLNNLTVIVAKDNQKLPQQVILTVTEVDALIDSSSVGDLADRWVKIIQTALIQAWQERQPAPRRQQVMTATIIILGLTFLSWVSIWWQRHLRNRFNLLKKQAKRQSDQNLPINSPPRKDRSQEPILAALGDSSNFRQQADIQRQLTLNILWKRLALIGLILLWFAGIAAILYVFPETRLEGRGIIRIPLQIFIIWLLMTSVSNMVNLYVNFRLREWVEEGAVFSENLERRILRAPTLLEVWREIITFIAIFLGILIFLAWMGLSFAFLLTGAGLVGALLTFAFQDLLKDWINGFLIVFEDQYTVGDMVQFQEFIGLVENMSLRATQLRAADGRLITIAHNQIITAHNLSKDWARVDFTIEVAYQTEPDVAIALMAAIAENMAVDPQWQEDIINPVQVAGVSRVSHTGMEIMLRIVVKRLRQWDIEREYRRRLKIAFEEKGIHIGIPQQSFLIAKDREQFKGQF
ncbi:MULTISPECIES: mechanosensitive ion channel family protein [Microcystis]|uniref:Mechanosensitive ion channel family protein n=1 Tax=Microcystis viridis FACHB-1342 TaxID=2692900 RepID=A0ABR8GAP4_MICVR|nr:MULTISPECIES: mechanosensitive ion channel family protein [Microcystis]MBD2600327.1 mechanosensitive ion channel family protein [Microcystis viridis FACHB-1342]MDB9387315.1 mechanosensitive ion channel family protein [Microcystis aeruginosa CS-583]ODV36198.1 Potassium efflux system KefA protein [Microcystis aeruginosa NIES-98]